MTFHDFLKTGREPFNETPSLQTQEFSPNLPRESGREPLNETPSLQTQEFSPNFTPENDPERSYETPSNANEKRNLSDEVGTEATNETPVSPIAPHSIEIPMVTEGTYDSTEPLTEIISATNKQFMIQILFFSALQVGTEATNETPVSPIAPQNGNRGNV
ncbi:hypothetical protein Bca101_048731 [Brassica carinata]